MARVVPFLIALTLAACATQPPEAVDEARFFSDAAFEARAVPADPDVFALSMEMRRYLRIEIARQVRERGPLHGLVEALESNSQLRLEYDAAVTRTAAEAFEARAGNCLSLTIMTAALARELGLAVSYRRVLSEPVWTRSGDTLIGSGHVNIVLQPTLAVARRNYERLRGIVIDFEPGADVQRQRSQEISERTVVAMFMNNRAAEALGREQLDEAYWWARGATLRDARFLEGFNTLGVIYSRHGDAARAERLFRHVLAREPENVSALANLANLLDKHGEPGAALALRDRLQRIEPHPPFHYFDLGMAALKRRDFAAARDHFRRELERNAYYHEAHFGLAVAYVALGEPGPARRHLDTALETSTNQSAHELYAAKLAWLRARRGH